MKRTRLNSRAKSGSVSWWKNKLDAVFSEYIRRKDANRGIAKCVTCGKTSPWKRLQNGHYISRSHLSTRYDEQNCHVQCIGCNIFKNGNMDEYAIYLVEKYGPDILAELNRRKQKIKKISLLEYQGLVEDYQNKINELYANRSTKRPSTSRVARGLKKPRGTGKGL